MFAVWANHYGGSRARPKLNFVLEDENTFHGKKFVLCDDPSKDASPNGLKSGLRRVAADVSIDIKSV